MRQRLSVLLFVCVAMLGVVAAESSAGASQVETAAASVAAPHRALLDRYCVTCHNERLLTAGIALDTLDLAAVGRGARVWEQVIKKLSVGAMPPPGRRRPARAAAEALVGYLETALDRAAAANVMVGRTETFHRLNRAEYRNAIRDLLQVEVDVAALLPADDADVHGFDNMAAVLSVSPTLLERYLSAARRISRLAVGLAPPVPSIETHRIPLLKYQDERLSEDLPFGSRGGIAVRHRFPVDGEYSIKLRLQRTYTDYIRGLGTPQALDVRVDGTLIERFIVGGGAPPHATAAPASFAGNTPLFGHPDWETYVLGADENLEVTFRAEAGERVVGVSFERKHWEAEGPLQPRQTGFPLAINERWQGNAAVDSVEIGGPYAVDGPGDTASRRAISVATRTAAMLRPPAPGRSFPGWQGGPIAGRSRGAISTCCSISTSGAGEPTASRPASSSLCSACSPIRSSCSGSRATRWTWRGASATR